jgi:nucleotide-binding universal stress UspA family protein
VKDIKKILFPVDLSESSEKLVPYVATMADKFQTEIHIPYVGRIFQYFTSIYVPHTSINKFEAELLQGAEKRMQEFKDTNFKAFPNTQTVVVLGDASEEIIHYSESEKIDLIIMGTHGRKGLDKVIFGSVAEQVVKTAPVPVMVVNPYKVP